MAAEAAPASLASALVTARWGLWRGASPEWPLKVGAGAGGVSHIPQRLD
jgi:hypothetical protein